MTRINQRAGGNREQWGVGTVPATSTRARAGKTTKLSVWNFYAHINPRTRGKDKTRACGPRRAAHQPAHARERPWYLASKRTLLYYSLFFCKSPIVDRTRSLFGDRRNPIISPCNHVVILHAHENFHRGERRAKSDSLDFVGQKAHLFARLSVFTFVNEMNIMWWTTLPDSALACGQERRNFCSSLRELKRQCPFST